MSTLENVFQTLEQQNWAVADGILPDGLCQELFSECQKSWQSGMFQESRIGRGAEKNRRPEIRGDAIFWLDPDRDKSNAGARFLAWTEELRQQLNERYYLGLKSAEFHFARYPEGKGYQKHLDQHRGQTQRKISLVLYLNPSWSQQDGGELCLYSPVQDTLEIRRVLPQAGRLVLFRSDLFPHEVLPCFQTRWSLTGWFRTDFPSVFS